MPSNCIKVSACLFALLSILHPSSILPPSFILHPSSFILHPSSFILHPSSFILHPSSFILHPSSFILHPSSFILHPSSFILHPSSSLHPPSSLILPASGEYHPMRGCHPRHYCLTHLKGAARVGECRRAPTAQFWKANFRCCCMPAPRLCKRVSTG